MTRSTKWFIGILAALAFFALGFIIVLTLVFNTFTSLDRNEVVTYGSGDKVAVVEIIGAIHSSEDVIRQLKNYREDHAIKAILLRIDSPGGGVVASQEIYEEVRKTRDTGTPIVVSMGALAASGGYYVACGGSRLVANKGTLTGSIGVVAEFLQLSDALQKLGIGVRTVKSGRLKDAGSSVRPMTKEDEKYFQDMIDVVHRQFVSVVEQERTLTHEHVLDLSDGRVFTGEDALSLGLVDTIGTFEDAVAIAAQMAGLEGEPAIVKERIRRRWWEGAFGDAAEKVAELKNELLDRPVLSYRFVGLP
jgi:protease-4